MRIVVIASFVVMCLLSCNQTKTDKIDEQDYAKTKESLESKEKKSPLRFLKVDADFHKNIIGQTVIKGEVKNIATVAVYKNIRLKLLYYNKEGKLFENHEEVLDGSLSPGDAKKYKAKYRTKEKTDSIAVSVMSADVEE